MKLLYEYTLDYIKRNRRSSLAIMVAILMVTTMLSALCGMLYNIYTDNLGFYLRASGNWHGELFDNSNGRDLSVVESFETVETTLLKGPWKTAKIDDPRRDFLIFRDADTQYWSSMPEGNLVIMEGRTPAATGEIALSKQYFEHHPELALGDTITLPLGDRVAPDGTVIPSNYEGVSGEQFRQTGDITLTVVAKLDMTTSSTVPGYMGLGYLDRATIAPTDELTIYMRFKNIGDTYKELPKIAQAVGYQLDEYGKYNLRYNSGYLTRKLVLSPEQQEAMSILATAQQPVMFAVMGLLAAAVFVLVIHNAFALSANARLTQLGVLASIGATPRQIKRSVLLEAGLLSVIPLPLGLLLGQVSVWLFIDRINLVNSLIQAEHDIPMAFSLGWQSVLPAILLTLLTVCWSALIPARRVARLSPVVAIRQGELQKLKKPRKHSLVAKLGVSAERAANAVRARKKSYRTATVSLLFSFLTLAALVCINSASATSRSVYAYQTAYKWEEQDISLTLRNVASPEDYAVTEQLAAIPGMTSAVWYTEQTTACWTPPDKLSNEFHAMGGFEGAMGVVVGLQPPLLRDGSYRIYSTFVGLDDAAFAAYCAELGLDPAPFYQTDKLRTILMHSVEDVTRSTKRDPVEIPLLGVQVGDTLAFTERLRDDTTGNYLTTPDGSEYTFDTEITAITDLYPPLGRRNFTGRYGLTHFLPMSRLNSVTKNFENDHSMQITGALQTATPEQIAPVRTEVERICESWFGSGDYDIWDYNEVVVNEQGGLLVTGLMFGFVAVLFAVIGLSNAWATVRGTLSARKREFAMLRSVGLPPKGLQKMLLYEALLLGLSPILMGLPVAVCIQAVFLSINEVTFMEWLPFAPWPVLLVYTVTVLAVVCLAYLCGGRAVLRGNIVESLKQDV